MKKKDPGGRVHRPSEKVRQAAHKCEETVHRHDAKAQKVHARHHHCHLIEEGSKNEVEENSDQGRDIEEDDIDEEEDGGTQVGHPNSLEALL